MLTSYNHLFITLLTNSTWLCCHCKCSIQQSKHEFKPKCSSLEFRVHMVLNSNPESLSPSSVSGFLFTVGSLCFSFTTITQQCYVTYLQNNPKTERRVGENLNLQVQNSFCFWWQYFLFQRQKKYIVKIIPRCNNCGLFFANALLYMFRVTIPPIIRSTRAVYGHR